MPLTSSASQLAMSWTLMLAFWDVGRSRVNASRHTSVLPSASLARVQSNTQLVHASGSKHASRPAERRLGDEVDPRLNVASSNEACAPLNVARLNEVFVLVA